MRTLSTKSRLLGGAVLSAGLAALTPSQVAAQCTFVGVDRVCTNTQTTTDASSFVDPTVRNAQYNSSIDTPNDSVAAGATVDGFGLAAVDTSNAANTYSLTNDGTVQVNVGNTPTAGGGDGAVYLQSVNNAISYSGSGNIANLGTGDGLEVLLTGNGSFTGTSSGTLSSVTGNGLNLETQGTGGISFTSTGTISSTNLRAVEADITAATGGNLTLILNNLTNGVTGNYNVLAFSASNTGNVNVTTNGTTTGLGINAQLTSATATGNVGVTNNGTTSGGIFASNAGTGGVTVVNNGAMTSVDGIDAISSNAAATGNVSVTGTGNISASNSDAIRIANAGTGTSTVNVSGSLSATNGNGVSLSATNAGAGAVNVTTGGITVTNGVGITTATAGTGLTTITVNNGIQAGTANTLQGGIDASSTGTGGITIRQTAGAIGTVADRAQGTGIRAAITNAASAGVIDVGTSAGTGINTVGDGINVSTNGTAAGGIIVNAAGAINSSTGDGIDATSTGGAINITTGNVTTLAAGTAGVRTSSTSGNQTINVNGALNTAANGVLANSTSGAIVANVNANITSGANAINLTSSTGPVTVNVAAGRVVDNTTTGSDIILNSGTQATINNSGTIGATTTGTAIFNSGFGTPNDINHLAGGIINGRFDLGDQVDTLDNAGIWNSGTGTTTCMLAMT